ncbi:MAG: hypothetical protein GY854_32795 [Deltaproteobacteria bacterium]|nr:hypothetical protein [Deltaproteobacteria bacterium]
MFNCTRIYIIWFLFLGLASGCGGAAAKKPKTVSRKARPTYKRVEVPAAITAEQRTLWEQKLYLLPSRHPARRDLRDRLAGTLLKDFERRKEEDIEGRLDLFKEALALHDPSDFRPEHVASDIVPMAKWIVDAFEKRGDEAVVLAGLRFLMMADPSDMGLKERYLELAEWSESVRETISGRVDRLSSLISMYRKMVRLVPDREVVEHLAKRYVERHRLILSMFKREAANGSRQMRPFETLMRGRALQVFPVEIIHIFFLVGDPAGARKHLAGFVAEGGIRVEFLELLDRIFEGKDPADSYFTLARYLAPVDARAGLRACIAAHASDPKDPRFSLCIGRSFEELDRPECAFDFYAEAAKVAPEEDVYEEVIELIRQALIKVHMNELQEVSKRAIELADSLVEVALEKHSKKESELKMVIASLLYTAGEVEFDDGRVEASRGHLKRSYEVMANIPALVKLTEVHYLLGDFNSGIEILKQARNLDRGGRQPTGFWQAVILEKRADLMSGLGRKEEASKLYKEALVQWDSAKIVPEQAPAAAVRRGIIHDRLGDMEASQAAFRLAVRLDPDRQATYAQVISFLVIQERLEDAKEFYRLAYNQDQIEAMWKIYYSIWLEGLSRRTGKGDFSLARNYLEHSRGESWQDNLARFFLGEISLEALRKEARNRGQLVEVDYYSALLDLAEKKAPEARAKLEKVIASNLLGFFEYRMARALLREELKTH